MRHGLICQRWYKILVHYPKRYRLYLTVVASLVLVCLWQLILYRPFGRAIHYYQTKNKNFQSMVQELQSAQQQTAVLTKNIQGLRHDLTKYQAQAHDVNGIMAAAIKEAIRNNLVLKSCAAEPLSEQGWHQSQAVRVEVQGALGNVAQWLKKISDVSTLFSVSSVAMVQVDQAVVRCSAILQIMHVRTLD